MGNEVSRPADGVSPQGMAGGAAPARGGSSFRLPTTPISTPSARRAKSFSSFQAASPPPPSSSSYGNGNGSTTPRARDAALQRQQSTPNVERTIQRMDKAIRKRVRGGITYNMKIIIRGEKGTGKTSLFHRLKGEPIPNEHETTPQLQSATINWNFRANSEENVKCEVWDVVDRGFNPLTEGSDGAVGGAAGAEQNASPFELGSLQSNSNFASVRASAAVAASIAGASGANGSHTVATVDASTVDVYHETHGAIFLLDVTKWHTLEYVRQQLEKVPVHIPTLVLGNFRDCGNQRKIFKEDIQDLLYGSSDRSRQQQQLRRPHELLYFECSLLNCYGLKSLHQYFGIPFLQLKLATIRQQMRIVEGEFSHLKNDLQAKISEQRYSDYVEHIKATGSDIRTGRKVPGASPPPAQPVEHSIVVNGSGGHSNSNGYINGNAEERNGNAASQERLGRTHSTASNGSDIVVVTEAGEKAAAPSAAESPVARASSISADVERQLTEPLQKDLDDLPERTNSLADQLTVPLKFEHSESLSSLKEEEQVSPPPAQVEESKLEESSKASKKAAKSKAQAKGKEAKDLAVLVKNSPVKTSRKPTAADEPVSLEDFQVPKQKNNDLDSFYSDEDSDANDESDEDVIVPPSAAMMKKYSHKQQFIYSDSSDSEEEMEKTRRKAKKSSSPRRRGVAKSIKSQDAVPEPLSTVFEESSEVIQHTTPDAKPTEAMKETVPSSPATAIKRPTTVVGDEPASASSNPERQPQPPSLPSAMHSPPRSRLISPAARTSRSPSPRHKLETSRSSSPKAIVQQAHQDLSTNGDDVNDVEQKEEETESETHEVEVEEIVVPENEIPVIKSLESPSGQMSPRRRLHLIKSAQSSQSPSSEDEGERKETPGASIEQDNGATGVVSGADESHKPEINADESEKSVNRVAFVVPESKEEISTNAEADQSARMDVETFGDLEYSEDDEHVVFSGGMDNFFFDDEDKSAVPSKASTVQTTEQAQKQSEAIIQSVEPIPKIPEMLMSDGEGVESETTQLPTVQSVPASIPCASEKNTKTQVTIDAEVDFDVPVSKEDDDKFFSDNDEEEVNEEKEVKVSSPVEKAPMPPQNVLRVNRRQGMLMSDDDSDSGDRATAKPKSQFSVTVSQSGTTTQASSIISSPVETRFVAPSPSNDLESFFSESDSDADGRAEMGNLRTATFPSPSARANTSKDPMRHAMAASDDDDEDGENTVDRFSSYNAKVTRKSKAERKQEREEIRRMSASMSSSRLMIEDLTPVATTIAPTANADVLAAIRLAQEEAIRMLPPSDDVKEDSARQERRHKKKSSSSSSSTSRSKHSEDPGASSSSRKKKSSSSSSSSSKLSSSASSRSSRRRDAGSGDERRESRRR